MSHLILNILQKNMPFEKEKKGLKFKGNWNQMMRQGKIKAKLLHQAILEYCFT